jgi:hypothetical protein
MKTGNKILRGIADGLFPSNLLKRDKDGKLDKVKIASSLISWGLFICFSTGKITIEDLITIVKFFYE